MRYALLNSIVFLAACSPGTQPEPLRLRAPTRISQPANSTNATLCAELDVTFTFGLASGSASPVFDGEALQPKPGETCAWTVPAREHVAAGTYDLIASFQSSAEHPSCDEPVIAGVFLLLDVSFPFDESFPGFVDELFFSGLPGEIDRVPIPDGQDGDDVRQRYRDALENLAIDFDLDADRLDNLTELAVGTDPCAVTLPPTVSLEVSDGSEGVELPFSVTLDLSGNPIGGFGLLVTIGHVNDLSAVAGIYTSTEIRITTLASAPAELSVDPAPGSVPRELWELSLPNTVSDLTWELGFRPDEPFIGVLTFAAEVTDVSGSPINGTRVSREVTIANLPDPIRLMLGQRNEGDPPSSAGDFVPGDSVSFAELFEGRNPSPPPENNLRTLWDFYLADDDFPASVALGPASWQPAIGVGDSGLALEIVDHDTHWTLSWLQPGASGGPDLVGPDNDLWLNQPPGGYDQSIDLWLAAGTAPFASVSLTVRVAPPLNDPGLLSAPSIGEQSLPSVAFAEHVARAHFFDPDRISGLAPSCELVIDHDPCTVSPFDSITCLAEPILGRAGFDGEWSINLGLVPAAFYETNCGTEPSFEVTLRVTDVQPVGATNGSLTISTSFTFVTGGVLASVGTYTGGPAAPPVETEISDTYGPAVIHGPSRLAIVSLVLDDPVNGSDERVFLVDLAEPGPSLIHEFPIGELCIMNPVDFPRENGVAWEGDPDGHFLVIGRRTTSGTDCNFGDELAVLLVDVDGSGQIHTTSYPISGPDIDCPTASPPYVVVADDGTYYLACYNAQGLHRITLNGDTVSIDLETLPAEILSSASHNLASLTDGSGNEWLVWPAEASAGAGIVDLTLHLFDLGTFDGIPGGFAPVDYYVGVVDTAGILDHAEDPHRHDFVFMTWFEDQVEPTIDGVHLHRLRFAGPSPVLEPTVAFFPDAIHTGGASHPSRLLLREYAGEPPAEADLVLAMQEELSPVTYVDLDVALGPASLVASRDPTPFDQTGHGLARSPDRRYFISLRQLTPELYSWDPTAEPLVLDLGVPTSFSTSGKSVTVSDSGHLILILEPNVIAPEKLEVIYFPMSRAGLD